MRGLLAAILAALLAGGCGGDPTGPRNAPWELMGVAQLAAVRGAPEAVQIGGVKMRLSTFLWRDFMPVAPPDGEPLRALLSIVTADSSAFPAHLKADAAWVLNGRLAWATGVQESRRVPGEPVLEVFAEGGPKWGPGIEVDVVVRLRAAGGKSWYLKARRQSIQRTD
jgi:hypothetical protein